MEQQEQVLDIDSAMDTVAAAMDTGTDDSDTTVTAGDDTSAAVSGAGKTAAEVIEELAMPQSWKKEWEPDWKATPNSARQRFIEREKQMLQGLEGYKGNAEYGSKLRKAIEPFMDILKAQGVDEVKAISYLLNSHKALSDPKQARGYLDRIIKNYGIKMDQAAAAADGAGAAPVAPEVKAALERLDRIEGSLTAREEAEMTARKEATSKDVEAFASDPAHPYFDECSEDIVKLIGAGYSLKDAYEKAVWANPVTRQKELGRLDKEKAAAAKQKALEIAKQAKKGTSTNVKGRDSARTPTEPAATVANMEDDMKETLAEIKSRT